VTLSSIKEDRGGEKGKKGMINRTRKRRPLPGGKRENEVMARRTKRRKNSRDRGGEDAHSTDEEGL